MSILIIVLKEEGLDGLGCFLWLILVLLLVGGIVAGVMVTPEFLPVYFTTMEGGITFAASCVAILIVNLIWSSSFDTGFAWLCGTELFSIASIIMCICSAPEFEHDFFTVVMMWIALYTAGFVIGAAVSGIITLICRAVSKR